MNGTFLCGYELNLLERFDVDTALEAIERHRVTLFEGVPTMYYYLLGAPTLGKTDLTSLTRATVGGQTMPESQLRECVQRLGVPILELWGMTEIAGLGTTHPAYGPPRLGSIGQALPYSQCRIASLKIPSRCAENGEPGELHFRGPTVMQGYHERPEATAEALMPDGWLRTGDIAYADDQGYLFVVDRLKEMIITSGFNIYPSEVERVIATHPAVQMVAVAGVADEAKGELAVAYVVVKPGQSVDSEALMSHCRAELAAYKVPRAVQFVADLPKTSTGKIMRRALGRHAQSICVMQGAV
jgi:long-chain acyl-CoA synthetase